MTMYSKNIPAKNPNYNYQGVLDNYFWITETIYKKYGDNLETHARIAFSMGEISYTSKSIEEFRSIAYGQKINVTSYDFDVTFRDNSVVFFSAMCIQEKLITVFSENKEAFIDICNLLEKRNHKREEKNNIIGFQINDSNLQIGEGNIIVSSAMKDKTNNKNYSTFWKGVFKDSLSNVFTYFIIGGLLWLITIFIKLLN